MRRTRGLTKLGWLTNRARLLVVPIVSMLALVLVGSADAANPTTLSISCTPKGTVAYTPTATSGGSHSLLGTYNGDVGHGRATSTFELAVTPANDDLSNAAPLPVPVTLTGTTEGATYADNDPELCSDAFAPVWYSLKLTRSGRLAVWLTVRGRVDSVVAVYRQDRSKLVDLGCDVSDVSGVAGVPFDVQSGTTYLVAVAAPYDAANRIKAQIG
jgi:hypothetical protein